MPGFAERLIKRWDLDRVQLAALARVQRGPGVGGAAAAPQDAKARERWRAVSNYLKFALFAFLGLGGIAGVLFPSFFMGMAFSFTLIMLIFGLPFLNHCTGVLLDTSENRILLHLPISGRTLLAARLSGVLRFAGWLAIAVSLPTAIALALRFGLVALLVFLFCLVLLLVFLVAVLLAGCLFALRNVSPARVREGISSFQTVLLVVATYTGARVLDSGAPLASLVPDLTGEPWWYVYPPGWMAGLLDFTVMGGTPFNRILAVMAVLAPLAALAACLRSFAGGGFTALLWRLEVVPAGKPPADDGLAASMSAMSEKISALVGERQERAVFEVTSKLMKRDAVLNRNLIPYIGAILLNAGVAVAKFRHAPLQGIPLLVFCYVPMLLAFSAPLIQYGAEWRAAWCYRLLPLARPGIVVAAAMQAYLVRFVLPVYLLLLVLGAVVWGSTLALHVLFAALATVLVCAYRFWSAVEAPPYSLDPALASHRLPGPGRLAFIPLAALLVAAHAGLAAAAAARGVIAGIVVLAGAAWLAPRLLRARQKPARGAGTPGAAG